ncbi:MAG: hypothetical protein K6G88_11795 [Lachnospiraceae bacterium]|nr:hypothetical protein [Lachnospiraceae bacterium]
MAGNYNKAAQLKYNKEKTTQVKLKLNNETDKEILAKLDEVASKQGYIKKLIQLDMKYNIIEKYADEK